MTNKSTSSIYSLAAVGLLSVPAVSMAQLSAIDELQVFQGESTDVVADTQLVSVFRKASA